LTGQCKFYVDTE